MVTKILPDLPVPRELLFLWTHWLWWHVAKYPGVFRALFSVLHGFSGHIFLGQSDNFSAEYWTRLHGVGESMCGYLPPKITEETSCSSQCQEITFLTSVGFLGDFTFSLLWRVDGAHAPSAVTATLGDSCPLTVYDCEPSADFCIAPWGRPLIMGLSQGWERHSFIATLLLKGILQAQLPIAMCHGPYRRSRRPGGTSLLMRVCSACRSAGDNFCRWCHSSREQQAI